MTPLDLDFWYAASVGFGLMLGFLGLIYGVALLIDWARDQFTYEGMKKWRRIGRALHTALIVCIIIFLVPVACFILGAAALGWLN